MHIVQLVKLAKVIANYGRAMSNEMLFSHRCVGGCVAFDSRSEN